MPTPNDVAAILANWSGPTTGARYKEFSTAAKLGQAYTPGQAAGTAQGAYDTAQLRNQIGQNYAGSAQAISNQIAATQDRYSKNKADISSILGNLSTIRLADKAKINQQFTSAINASNAANTARTAQAQAQLKLGQQGAATAGAELGAGPTQMPTDSLTSQAVAQGIADANANQGTWGNLMNSMNMQQQADVDTAARGIDLQQAGAIEQLQRDYEAAMLGLGNQQLSLQDQISQGVAGIKSAQASAGYDQAMQELKNKGLTDVAQIRAAGQLAAKQAGGSKTTSPVKYTNDALGFAQRVKDANLNYDQMSQSISTAFGKVRDVNNAAAETSGLAAQKPTGAAVLAAWKSMNRKNPAYSTYLPYVEQYIKMNY